MEVLGSPGWPQWLAVLKIILQDVFEPCLSNEKSSKTITLVVGDC